MCGTTHASHHKHSCPSPNNPSMSKWPPNACGKVENSFLTPKYRVKWFPGWSGDALCCYWERLETCKDQLQCKVHVINKENTLSNVKISLKVSKEFGNRNWITLGPTSSPHQSQSFTGTQLHISSKSPQTFRSPTCLIYKCQRCAQGKPKCSNKVGDWVRKNR